MGYRPNVRQAGHNAAKNRRAWRASRVDRHQSRKPLQSDNSPKCRTLPNTPTNSGKIIYAYYLKNSNSALCGEINTFQQYIII